VNKNLDDFILMTREGI